MDTPVETIHKDKTIIKIYSDDNPESPREWDNLGTMACFHRRYNLGDKHTFCNELYYVGNGEWDNYEDSPEGLKQFLSRSDVISLPLWLYDHSMQSISTTSFYGRAQHAEWDSGMVGYIYVTKERIRSEFRIKRVTKKQVERAIACMQSEVKTYDEYMQGDVYGFRVECEQCGEEIDACWGFYGHDWKENGLLEYAEGNECKDCKETAERLANVCQLEFAI